MQRDALIDAAMALCERLERPNGNRRDRRVDVASARARLRHVIEEIRKENGR